MRGRNAPGASSHADSRKISPAHQAPDPAGTASQSARDLADGHQLDRFAHKSLPRGASTVTTRGALGKVDAPRGAYQEP